MIEAFYGILIASIATICLVVSIGISSKSQKDVGRQSLTKEEKLLIRNSGYSEKELKSLENDLKNINF